jgi:hypothetical protein
MKRCDPHYKVRRAGRCRALQSAASVSWSMESSLASARNCLGCASRDTGQRRLPIPPQRSTGTSMVNAPRGVDARLRHGRAARLVPRMHYTMQRHRSMGCKPSHFVIALTRPERHTPRRRRAIRQLHHTPLQAVQRNGGASNTGTASNRQRTTGSERQAANDRQRTTGSERQAANDRQRKKQLRQIRADRLRHGRDVRTRQRPAADRPDADDGPDHRDQPRVASSARASSSPNSISTPTSGFSPVTFPATRSCRAAWAWTPCGSWWASTWRGAATPGAVERSAPGEIKFTGQVLPTPPASPTSIESSA